jgi:opacity protein-like surface antigen
MQKEKLVFWPLTMSTYAEGEGRETQYPFPSYENGDLFLSWGSVAVKAYADYKPELALKYVTNVMARHSQDGLAFQRYGREKQDGLGDDILSGNSLSVVGLYQAIYGINPLYNRFYLSPHITNQLAGTELKYNYQGQKLAIGLDMNRYSVSNGRSKITSGKDFGFRSLGNQLSYFAGNNSTASLVVKTEGNNTIALEVKNWSTTQMSWIESAGRKSKISYTINDLSANAYYVVRVNDKAMPHIKSNATGSLNFTHISSSTNEQIEITKE